VKHVPDKTTVPYFYLFTFRRFTATPISASCDCPVFRTNPLRIEEHGEDSEGAVSLVS